MKTIKVRVAVAYDHETGEWAATGASDDGNAIADKDMMADAQGLLWDSEPLGFMTGEFEVPEPQEVEGTVER